MTEIKKNTIMWVSLVVLIILNYLFAENHMDYSVYLIVMVSGAKFLGVVYQFIEAKHAYVAWKALSIAFVVIYLIGVLVLS